MKKSTTHTQTKALQQQLHDAVVEKDVENAYRQILDASLRPKQCYPASPHQCDGFYTGNMFLRLLLEAKFSENFLEKSVQCGTLLQAVAYIHKFREAGEDLPNVVLCGDVNECFVVSGSPLYKYLEADADWSIAPSSFAKEHPELVLRMVDDSDISPFVFAVNDQRFDFEEVIRAIDQLCISTDLQKIPVNEANIRAVYEQFLRTFFPTEKTNYEPNLLVSAFVRMLLGDPNTYIHPNKPNVLHMESENGSSQELQINGPAFYAFFSRFSKDYKPSEKKTITEIADRLIEETKRRWQGSFWTPTIWAANAQTMISNSFGPKWKKEYVVWDPCCGSLNLTRDDYYENLYCSTLFQEELDLGAAYNPEAKAKFQYDFLNDEIDVSPLNPPTKMPEGLYKALCEDKPILFLANPPYKTAQDAKMQGATAGITSDNLMNVNMRDDSAGQASQQAFAQFFWRIFKLKRDFKLSNVAICFFCNPLFYTGVHYNKFRARLFSEFEFLGGNLFKASEFSDVSDAWGITFSMFKSLNDLREFSQNKEYTWFLTLERTSKEGTIEQVGKKAFSAFPEEMGCDKWIREPVQDKPKLETWYPQLSSALKESTAKQKPSGSLVEGSMGYLVNVSNDVYNSATNVSFFSASAYRGHGVPVCAENFERVVANAAARKAIEHDWTNNKDRFRIPDTNNKNYQKWLVNALVYFLFNQANSAAAARVFVSKTGNTYNMKNEMFFMSKKEIRETAEAESCAGVYNDVLVSEERYAYLWLSDKQRKSLLSCDSKILLEIAAQIIKSTMCKRDALSVLHPESYLSSWDAGWYQIKQIMKYLNKPLPKEFKEAYGRLEQYIRNGVYEFGFLKKD